MTSIPPPTSERGPAAPTATISRRAVREVLLLIAIGLALRVVLALLLGLGVDETYEVVVGRRPSLSYLDHPPLSFWIPALVSRIFYTEHRLALRLPFILMFAGTTWLTFRLGARLFGDRAGVLAAVLLNLAPVLSLAAGGWILPDGPLDLALVAAALCLARALVPDAGVPRATMRWWLGAGAAAGVAALSKYHAIFLVLGVLAYVASVRGARRWLARPEPYAAGLVALALASPVIVWNLEHGWASFRFQGGRGAPHGLHPEALLQNLAGQAGYVLPWIWLPLAWQLLRGLRAGPRDPARWLLVCLGAGPVLAFTLVSLGGNPGLPHWPAPGWLLLLPLLGDALARYEARGPVAARRVRRYVIGSAAAFLALTAVAASQVATGWIGVLAPGWFRRGDPSLEAVDWRDLRPALEARGLLGPGAAGPAFVAAPHWIDAAKVGYSLGNRWPVLCLSDDPRHFRFLYDQRPLVGRDGLLLARLDPRHPRDVAAELAPLFAATSPADTVAVTRMGRTVIRVGVWRGRLVGERRE